VKDQKNIDSIASGYILFSQQESYLALSREQCCFVDRDHAADWIQLFVSRRLGDYPAKKADRVINTGLTT
jgi:hypothetical protein